MNYLRNSGAASIATRKLAVSLVDSSDLRVILSVFYTIVEVLRCTQEDDTEEFKQIQKEFRAEICKNIIMEVPSRIVQSVNIFATSSTDQRRALGRQAFGHGYQILQWIMPSLSHEEGPVASLESASSLIRRHERAKGTQM